MVQPPQLPGRVFGSGNGAGMALMFFLSGFICAVLSVAFMFNRTMQKAETAAESTLSFTA
jgi:hypothetical protein